MWRSDASVHAYRKYPGQICAGSDAGRDDAPLCSAEKAAENAGRVEFSGGIIDQLAEAFCDSCYVDAVNFCDTLEALLEAFYYYKSDMEDALTDEELIAAMRLMFDRCEGTLELVTGRELECMARRIRYGRGGIVDGAESGD